MEDLKRELFIGITPKEERQLALFYSQLRKNFPPHLLEGPGQFDVCLIDVMCGISSNQAVHSSGLMVEACRELRRVNVVKVCLHCADSGLAIEDY